MDGLFTSQTGKMANASLISNDKWNRFLVFGKQTYTREAAAIVFEIFRSITLQENRFFVDGKHINTRETAARIVFVDDIFRAVTRQVQYMAIHCTPKMNELNLCTNTWQNLHVKNDTKI